MLKETYPGEEADENCISDYCLRLSQLGPENVVITDVGFRPGQTGVAVYSKGMERPVYLFRARIDRVFHGTGDIFASSLLGALMNGHSLTKAVEIALDFTHAGIRRTVESGEPLRYGIQFEDVLPEYWTRLHA